MIDLSLNKVEAYLKRAFGPSATLIAAGDIGTLDTQGIKRFGYGKPILIKFSVDGSPKEAVLSVMRGDKYGHQFYWDRAAILMFQYETGDRLERHVRSLGLGYVDPEDELIPLQRPKEFFILNEKLEGYDYYRDLERIRQGNMRPDDEAMAREFALWLARIHSEKLLDPDLYYRAVRNLIGSSECIMGLIDEAYPHPYNEYSDERFMALEQKITHWRWKLKKYAHRLSVVHGDFHPWNVLVTNGSKFSVLDRSRGEWGEPANDVSTMAINYLLFGLFDTPTLAGPFERLYRIFFDTYLEATNDQEMLDVIAPFFVFRGLVIASPEWYPNHPPAVRQGLFRFLENVLSDASFAYQDINRYMQG